MAERDERCCLTHNEPWWSVFYSERGERRGERRFAREDEACEALLARLLTDPKGPLDADEHAPLHAADKRVLEES